MSEDEAESEYVDLGPLARHLKATVPDKMAGTSKSIFHFSLVFIFSI